MYRSCMSPYMYLSAALTDCASFLVFSDPNQWEYGTSNHYEGGRIQCLGNQQPVHCERRVPQKCFQCVLIKTSPLHQIILIFFFSLIFSSCVLFMSIMGRRFVKR